MLKIYLKPEIILLKWKIRNIVQITKGLIVFLTDTKGLKTLRKKRTMWLDPVFFSNRSRTNRNHTIFACFGGGKKIASDFLFERKSCSIYGCTFKLACKMAGDKAFHTEELPAKCVNTGL